MPSDPPPIRPGIDDRPRVEFRCSCGYSCNGDNYFIYGVVSDHYRCPESNWITLHCQRCHSGKSGPWFRTPLNEWDVHWRNGLHTCWPNARTLPSDAEAIRIGFRQLQL